MTLDRNAVLARMEAWVRAHPPDTGYTRRVFRQVFSANLPPGTCLLMQICAQFTGREEPGLDLVAWDSPETRTPYSNTYRMTFDRSVDCSSAWYILYQILFGISIGTWSEAQYKLLRPKTVPWSSRRVGDIVFWNFKTGRTVSHVGGIVREPGPDGRGGLIAHTTSPTNPWRIEPDTYAASNRVAVCRALSDAQYQSLIIGSDWSGEDADMLIRNDPRKQAVAQWQRVLALLGYSLGTWPSLIDGARDGSDGSYGSMTVAATAKFQTDYKVQTTNTGMADDVTILAAAWALAGRGVDTAEVEALKATIADYKTAFGQIADLAAPRR